jgi:hypothetical protein
MVGEKISLRQAKEVRNKKRRRMPKPKEARNNKRRRRMDDK